MLTSSSKRAGRTLAGISPSSSTSTTYNSSRPYLLSSSRTSSTAYSLNRRNAILSINSKLSQSHYTTERVLQLRNSALNSSKKDSKRPTLPATLYDATRETENCGVGLVASLKSVPSRKVVEQADEMLVRMSHRGGCGCDPASGDGAGKMCL